MEYRQEAVSDGTLDELALSLEYFSRSEITVYFDDVEVPEADSRWNWLGSTSSTLQFTPAVPNGVEVAVVRRTAVDAMRHRFSAGALFKQDVLDENFEQLRRSRVENPVIVDVDASALPATAPPGLTGSFVQFVLNSIGAKLSGVAAALGLGANVPTQAEGWVAVPEVTTDNVGLSGLAGPLNAQAVALLRRSEFVKARIDAPYVITGVASIKNPTYGAPVTGAEDPSAAAANAAAIQTMLNSGARRVELDDKARRVNNTLTVASALRIDGGGRAAGGLVWTGGDFPVLARAGFASANSAGVANTRLHNLLIQDTAASRVNHWTVDLTNADSCGITDCWIDIQGAGGAAHKYGLALGTARGGAYAGLTFVVHVRNSRIAGGTVLINTSDWYVSGSEIWGNGRENALMIGAGGTICDGTQIVPGTNAGVYCFNDGGSNLATLKIADTYFDGSYNEIVTGTGIKTAPGIGLLGAEINGNNFWHLNGGGINVGSMTGCNIDSTFDDCDSMGAGIADIVIAAMQSTSIRTRHIRSPTAPKTGAARAVLGPVMQLTGQVGFPVNEVNAQVSYDSTYTAAVYTNPNQFKTPSGDKMTKVFYSIYPDAAQFKGEIVNVGGAPRFSNGTAWFNVTTS